MKQKFRTKIGLEFVAVLVFVFLIGISVETFWINLVMLAAIFVIFKGIYYEIEGETLTVTNSFFFKTKIPVKDIKSITETNNPLSAPAGSLDRLYIDYGKGEALISPVRTTEFIAALKKINPTIQVSLKKEQTLFSKLAV